MKNKYKKAVIDVLRYAKHLQFDEDIQPASLEVVMAEVKEKLDNACKTLDEVTVQGVLHSNTAARRKDRMCKALVRAAIVKGLLKKPDDVFIPAYKILNYTIPVCTMVREPRPWQLPGWKSPWMLFREYRKWNKMMAIRRSAEEAAAKEAAVAA